MAQTPNAPSGQPPVVNQGSGSAYSTGQRGGITAGTVNIAPGRLAFSDELGSDLLAHMPAKKRVVMQSVGGSADQNVASEFEVFLQKNGYEVQRMSIGVMGPPPDRKISLTDMPDRYVLTIRQARIKSEQQPLSCPASLPAPAEIDARPVPHCQQCDTIYSESVSDFKLNGPILPSNNMYNMNNTRP